MTPREQDMGCALFQEYFTDDALRLLRAAIALALDEDGPDLTAEGIFPPDKNIRAAIVAKETSLVAGLPLIPLIFEVYGESGLWQHRAQDGARVVAGQEITRIHGSAATVLKVERVILNFITHLSGIANLTARYVQQLEGTGVTLLDTRKTLPGLRWPEKYAVRVGGGSNHRRNLAEMLMLKDNHIDAAGSITAAVARLRARYAPCPPIEVECRTCREVREAVAAQAERVMLDNMSLPLLAQALPLIPPHIEAEISGGVTLENIRALALSSPRRPDFISVGRLTHSAVAADFSMRILCCDPQSAPPAD